MTLKHTKHVPFFKLSLFNLTFGDSMC